jgi:hypothetical protein
METFKELKEALINKKTLVWDDPDPQEGNNIITFVESLDDIEDDEDPSGYPILIQYGEGSEAEVLLSEINLLRDHEVHEDNGMGMLVGDFDEDEINYYNNTRNMLNSKNLCGRQYSSYGSASRAIKIVEKREGICFDKASINQLDETCFEVLIN